MPARKEAFRDDRLGMQDEFARVRWVALCGALCWRVSHLCCRKVTFARSLLGKVCIFLSGNHENVKSRPTLWQPLIELLR